MRVRGAGHLFRPTYRDAKGEVKQSAVFWWKLGRTRVSTGCRTEAEAQRWAIERLVEMRRGHLVGMKAAAPSWDDLERMLEDRWTLDGRRGLLQARSSLRHLRRAFVGSRADTLTTDRITSYAVRRRQEGAAPATVNLELAILRRALGIAREAGRIVTIPIIHRLPGVGHRTGTIERGDFEAIVAELPPRYVPPIRLLWLTGWRLGEGVGLTWNRVDLGAGELRLDTSKTGEPRVIHFSATSALHTLLTQVDDDRKSLSPYLFPGRLGLRMDRTAIQKAWRRACVTAGCPRALIHDLRRSMVRDMRRAGVSLAVAMGTVGHRSLTVHQGYSTVAPEDFEHGLACVEALRAGEPVQRRLASI
jgi:integrase